MMQRVLMILLLSLALVAATQAQENNPVLSLDTETTELQTGQEYLVNLRLSNADNIWLVSAELTYNPEYLYIVGTMSGAPVSQGELFPFDQSIEVYDFVRDSSLHYLVSRLAPAEPINGNGIVAQFRIYPLAAGNVEITFSDAELNRVVFTRDAQGSPIPGTPEVIRPAVTVLRLSITGETVAAPSEATATPTVTPTNPGPNSAGTSQVEPTLQVVDAPTTSPDATNTAVDMADSNSPLLLYLGMGLILLAVIGAALVFRMWRKKSKS